MQVRDDGDPFPPTSPSESLTFTWYRTSRDDPPGTLPLAQDVAFSRLPIAADTFKVGDTAVIRLEVHDRRADAVDKILLRCGDAPFCSTIDPITNDECFERVSWTVGWNL